MNRKIGTLATLFIALALLLGSVQEAQAKRMGGGKSFGSKPSYSTPFQRSTSPTGASSQPTRSASQQQAAAQNQTARQNWAGRGGLMGMLGGLALGGLLGSLFFGGAFENINLMDMLLFAGVAYLLYRLFAARSRQQPAAPAGYGPAHSQPAESQNYYRENQQPAAGGSGFDTDVLFKKGRTAGSGSNDYQQAASFDATNLPAGFDQRAFLSGAESAYRYLQAAWDRRDLAEIRGLTTDKVFVEIQEQLRASNDINKTDVLKLSAELMDVREAGTELEAVVLFDALISEDGGKAEAIKEVWHFVKPINSNQTRWFLDGIQQFAE
ncbi:Tim44-like domain-containing protein [Methylomonas sp. BW4-1]|uniref:Tim44-like domain-containing protein n=1 Tax=Methylomonas defluvii TaxID=3045149 RepID=A0ABU4UED7_9GAMM|nr:Tim44-like domain-containing protein [Methylomonas sp. OY6]MDX8127835.1 Tim44-like domain-containing protein [Methylomonas sp. OY6]